MASPDPAAIGLSRELIADTSRWRMGVVIEQPLIRVLAYDPAAKTPDDSPVVCRDILVAGSDDIHDFEEAVYDNPFLLRDFARVDILYRTEAALSAPDGLQQADYEAMHREAFPDNIGDVVVVDPPMAGARMVYAVPYSMHGFLSRTFYQAALRHPLSVLTGFFTKGGVRGNSPRLHVNFFDSPRRIDLVATRGCKLLLTNSFRVNSVDDALYYVLAVRRQLGMESAPASQVLASGAGELRREVTNRLAHYLNNPVMPVIFPTTLLGLGVNPEQVALEMAITPLCD